MDVVSEEFKSLENIIEFSCPASPFLAHKRHQLCQDEGDVAWPDMISFFNVLLVKMRSLIFYTIILNRNIQEILSI